jgi:cell shape-determining protein MreD
MAKLKIILLFFLIICLNVLQISFLFKSPVLRYLNLTLILMILLLIFNKFKFALLTALAGGILFDLYSIFKPGVFFLAFLLTLFISYKIIKEFSQMSINSVLIVAILCNLVYQAIIFIIIWLVYFLNLQNFMVVMDRFYWFNFCWSVLANSLTIIMGYSIVKTLRQ